jgi:hypothetical protein
MLLLRARIDEAGPGGFNAAMSYATFQARVLPRLLAPAAPYARSPFDSGKGPPHAFALYKAAQRASQFSARELARALARAADVDVSLKSSAPVVETISAYVGDLIGGVASRRP